MTETFTTKDSGERVNFTSGMTRDTSTGKINYRRLLDGPMLERWADLLFRGAEKYPDVSPGIANWTLANGVEELRRFEESAFRHFMQWIRGDRDEDHAAAIFFNVNGAEFTRKKLQAQKTAEPNSTLHVLPTFKPNHGTLNEHYDAYPSGS